MQANGYQMKALATEGFDGEWSEIDANCRREDDI